MLYNPEYNEYTKEDLEKIGIYDLRELGREIGVPSPTSMKKDQLIDYIVGIIHGEKPKNDNSLRGRPAKTGQKSYQKFIDLIDKIEAPKINNNFVAKSEKQYEESFPYYDTITSRVASYKSDYTNDAKGQKDDILHKGIVCAENNQFFVRKLRFVSSENDTVIPLIIVSEYGLKDNDIIEYFIDDDKNVVSQVIKVNGKFINKLDVVNTKTQLSCPSEVVKVADNISFKSKSSYVVISTSSEERANFIDKISEKFGENGYSVCKVCFDRMNPNQKNKNGLEMTEYYPESVGDEFETISMIESAIERAKFYFALGSKTLLIIDNLSWLISVVDSYPTSIYGNFIQKLARLGVSNQISVLCLTSPMSEELMNKYIGVFDYIVNIDKKQL